jgi:hypothetical protein
MIADSNVLDATGAADLPRAWDPDLAERLDLPQTRPGWDVGPERRIDDGRTMARMLGWASIGLGALEVAAPGRIAEFLGVDEDKAGFIRMMGMREIAQGMVILNSKDPEPGIWARIAGDALDIGALGVALASDRSNKGAVVGALAFVGAVTAMDVMCAAQLRSDPS